MISMKLHDTNGVHVIVRFKDGGIDSARSYTFCTMRWGNVYMEATVDDALDSMTPCELYEVAEKMFSEAAKSQGKFVFLEAGYTLYGRSAKCRNVSTCNQNNRL